MAAADLTETGEAVAVSAMAMLDRVKAEARGLRLDFACFSLRKIEIAMGSTPGAAEMRTQLRRKLAAFW